MTKKLSCPKCSRKFSMPAHLARHMNTIHAAGGAKTATSGKRLGRPKGSTNKRPATVAASTSFGGPARLLSDMRAYHSDLSAQRMTLDTQIEAVANAMQTLGGSTPAMAPPAKSTGAVKLGRPKGSGARRGRPPGQAPRKGSLKDYIVRVLGQVSKPLSPNDIGTRVVKAGFKTKAKDLTKAVSNTLPTLKNIKRIGFGQYQLG